MNVQTVALNRSHTWTRTNAPSSFNFTIRLYDGCVYLSAYLCLCLWVYAYVCRTNLNKCIDNISTNPFFVCKHNTHIHTNTLSFYIRILCTLYIFFFSFFCYCNLSCVYELALKARTHNSRETIIESTHRVISIAAMAQVLRWICVFFSLLVDVC